MTSRRRRGDETIARLRDWSESPKSAERLAAHVLAADAFVSIDPTHPLGGPDGLKDLVGTKEGLKWIGAAYFPFGDKSFSQIRKKFAHDVRGAKKHAVPGFVFITNQHLTDSQRRELAESASELRVEVYHRERVAGILDRSESYGIRLEFLDIEMNKSEQLSFFAKVSGHIMAVREELQVLRGQVQALEPSDASLAQTLSRLESTLAPLSGSHFTVSVIPAPLERLERVLDRLDRSSVAQLLEGGVPNLTTSVLPSPLARVENVVGRLEELMPNVEAVLGGGQPATSILPSPIERLERVLNRLERLPIEELVHCARPDFSSPLARAERVLDQVERLAPRIEEVLGEGKASTFASVVTRFESILRELVPLLDRVDAEANKLGAKIGRRADEA